MGSLDKLFTTIPSAQGTSGSQYPNRDAGLLASSSDTAPVIEILQNYGNEPCLNNDLHGGGPQAAFAAGSAAMDVTGKALIVARAAPHAVKAAAKIPDVLGKLRPLAAIADTAAPEAASSAVSSALAADIGAAGGNAGAIAEAASGGLRYLGPIGVGLSVAGTAGEYFAASHAGDGYRQARAIGTGAGGALGLGASIGIGAAIGTGAIPIPIVGTVSGAIVGLAAGIVVGGAATLAGRKAGEMVLGPRMQAAMDNQTKAARDVEIAQLSGIEKKFDDVNAVGGAQNAFVAALKTNDPSRISQAKTALQTAATGVAHFEGLSANDTQILTAMKHDLTTAWNNERALTIPKRDMAAKTRQQQAMTSLATAIVSIDSLTDRDKQIKAKLTPDARQEILAGNRQIQQIADNRITEINRSEAMNAPLVSTPMQSAIQQVDKHVTSGLADLGAKYTPLPDGEIHNPAGENLARNNTASTPGTPVRLS